MSKCNVCGLQFRSIDALEQHERDSIKHARRLQLQQHQQGHGSSSETFACQPCGRHFRTIDALQQHAEATRHGAVEVLRRSTPGPSSMTAKVEGGTFKRQFDSNSALLRHQRELPSHTTEALQHSAHNPPLGAEWTDCGPCGRQFANFEALQQHKRDSPAHRTHAHQESAPGVAIAPSTFRDLSTISRQLDGANQPNLSIRRQHHSTQRASKFPCSQCTRSFRSDSALQMHTNDFHARLENSPWSMHPDLHDEVSQRLQTNRISLEFYEDGELDDSIRDYDTYVMGAFTCPNQSCRIQRWMSNKIAISIRLYDDERYNAIVWHQRCKKCKSIGNLELDVQSYMDRVVYRLGKWFGLDAEVPPFSGNIGNGPHRQALCEGCKNGHCERR